MRSAVVRVSHALTRFARWKLRATTCVLMAGLVGCGGGGSGPHTPVGHQITAPMASGTLADWGLHSVQEIAFLTVAVLESPGGASTLAVYDLRDSAPTQGEAGALLWRSEAPMLSDGAFVISRFTSGNYNRLGGAFGSFSKTPSVGDAEILGGSKGLRLRFSRSTSGFVGLWMHLFDDRAMVEERTYLHTGAASHLVFEVRGAAGKEPITLRVADRVWLEKGDSKAVGPLSKYIASGAIRRRWQRVVVPLADLPEGLEHEELAALVLQVDTPAASEVFIRNLGLTANARVELPRASDRRTARGARASRRALWVWRTNDLVQSAALRSELIGVCETHGATDVFLQLVSRRNERAWNGMLDLVEQLHSVGIRVQALDGNPKYAQRSHHAIALGIAQAVATSNHHQPRKRRFDGLRFDIEPYLLPGFRGPAKGAMLRDYLEVLDGLRDIAKREHLPLGVDIPFWFDGVNQYGEPSAAVDGRSVSELVMDRVDNIAIMAYRTRPYGADGILAHVMDELEYAERTGTGVFVGLETGPLPDESVGEFVRSSQNWVDTLWVWGELDGRFEMALIRSGDSSGTAAIRRAHPKAMAFSMRSNTLAPASKISFGRLGATELSAAVARIAEELGGRDSEVGVALHAFDSLRKLSKASSRDAD